MADKKSLKLIITFAERGKGKTLAKLYTQQGIFCSYQCMGRGTASSDLLDVLGIGSAEKDILISMTSNDKADRLLNKLDNELQDDTYGRDPFESLKISRDNLIKMGYADWFELEK